MLCRIVVVRSANSTELTLGAVRSSSFFRRGLNAHRRARKDRGAIHDFLATVNLTDEPIQDQRSLAAFGPPRVPRTRRTSAGLVVPVATISQARCQIEVIPSATACCWRV